MRSRTPCCGRRAMSATTRRPASRARPARCSCRDSTERAGRTGRPTRTTSVAIARSRARANSISGSRWYSASLPTGCPSFGATLRRSSGVRVPIGAGANCSKHGVNGTPGMHTAMRQHAQPSANGRPARASSWSKDPQIPVTVRRRADRRPATRGVDQTRVLLLGQQAGRVGVERSGCRGTGGPGGGGQRNDDAGQQARIGFGCGCAKRSTDLGSGPASQLPSAVAPWAGRPGWNPAGRPAAGRWVVDATRRSGAPTAGRRRIAPWAGGPGPWMALLLDVRVNHVASHSSCLRPGPRAAPPSSTAINTE